MPICECCGLPAKKGITIKCETTNKEYFICYIRCKGPATLMQLVQNSKLRKKNNGNSKDNM